MSNIGINNYLEYQNESIMFNDDFWSNNDDDMDENSMEVLVAAYYQLKAGETDRILTEDEFEILIDYFYQESIEQEALEACNLAQVYYPFSSSILLLKAEILFYSQKFGQALLCLDEYDEIEFQSIDSIILRCDIFKAQQRFDEAIRFIHNKMDFFESKELIDLYMELVEIYDEINEYEKVFQSLQEILKIDFKNEEALHKMSFWTDFTKRYNESIVLHQSILEEDPYNALAWFNLGTAFQGKKEYLSAIDAYEFCLVVDEKFEFAYRNLADAYIKIRWYPKAIIALGKYINLAKPEDVIYEAMAYCYEKINDYETARQFYELALELNPTDEDIYFKIGNLYAKEERWDLAINKFEKALQLNKGHIKSLQALGLSLIRVEEYDFGFSILKKGAQIKPKNIKPWLIYIRELIKHDLFSEASLAIDEASFNIGQHIDLQYMNAVVHFGLNQQQEAMLILEDALSEDPKKVNQIFKWMPNLKERPSVIQLIEQYKNV